MDVLDVLVRQHLVREPRTRVSMRRPCTRVRRLAVRSTVDQFPLLRLGFVGSSGRRWVDSRVGGQVGEVERR